MKSFIILLVITAVTTGLIWLFRAAWKETDFIEGKLDEFEAKAKDPNITKVELLAAHKELVTFANEWCRTKFFAPRAREVDAFIKGRLTGMKD